MSQVEGIYCRRCGTSIATGFSWNGWCVVCAEPHVKAEERKGPKWLADAIAKCKADVARQHSGRGTD